MYPTLQMRLYVHNRTVQRKFFLIKRSRGDSPEFWYICYIVTLALYHILEGFAMLLWQTILNFQGSRPVQR